MYSYHTQLDKICQTDSRETTVKRRHASRIGVPVGASASRGPRTVSKAAVRSSRQRTDI